MSPLNLKLNDVDTSMPLLMEGKYPVTIEKVDLVESKKQPGCYNLKVDFKTTGPAMDQKTGKEIPAGYPLNRYYPIPPYGNGDNDEMFKKGLALLQLAVCNLKNTEENVRSLPAFDDAFLRDMPGKQVVASVKNSKNKDGEESEYGVKSEVNAVYAIG